MPPTIHINVFTGPGVAKRESFSESPVSFGREAGNSIVLSEKTASRRHGELRYEADQWVLVNLSPNGTWVDRKSVTKKPHVLKDRETVRIGDTPVFEVGFSSSARESEPEADSADQDAKAPLKSDKTTKYVLMYLLYMALIGGAIWFFSVYANKATVSGVQTKELTETQIREEILSPLDVPADAREAAAKLQFAGELYNSLDETSTLALYKAYDAYRLALAYSGGKKFEHGTDQLRFEDVQTRLIRAVTRKYHDGFAQLRSGRYKDAQSTFHTLIQTLYPVPSSEVFKNCELLRKEAVDALKQQRP